MKSYFQVHLFNRLIGLILWFHLDFQKSVVRNRLRINFDRFQSPNVSTFSNSPISSRVNSSTLSNSSSESLSSFADISFSKKSSFFFGVHFGVQNSTVKLLTDMLATALVLTITQCVILITFFVGRIIVHNCRDIWANYARRFHCGPPGRHDRSVKAAQIGANWCWFWRFIFRLGLARGSRIVAKGIFFLEKIFLVKLTFL